MKLRPVSYLFNYIFSKVLFLKIRSQSVDCQSSTLNDGDEAAEGKSNLILSFSI
jgi:hypothetical protein